MAHRVFQMTAQRKSLLLLTGSLQICRSAYLSPPSRVQQFRALEGILRQYFATTRRCRQNSNAIHTNNADIGVAASRLSLPVGEKTTHFGFETVTESEKTQRVAGVFTNVAESYDRMNDIMSFGWHRVWKDHFVTSLNPGFTAGLKAAPQQILDVAGGTGDIAFRLLKQAHVVNTSPDTRVTISDINPAMLAVGLERARTQLTINQQAALSFLEADATSFRRTDGTPAVATSSVDLYTVAFGIRNFTDIPAALREAYRVLKPGGVFACLEFSKIASTEKNPAAALLDAFYKRWSFSAIPLIGQLVAGDRDSYQYLVESIERFPSQIEFRDMIIDAGFIVGGCGYENLSGGIAAIHKGMKPLEG